MYQTAYWDVYPFIAGGVFRGDAGGGLRKMIFDSGAEYDLADVDETSGGSVFGLDGEDVETNDLHMVENLNLLSHKEFINSWKNYRCPQAGSEIMDRSDPSTAPMWGFVDVGGSDKIFTDYAYHIGYHTTMASQKSNASRLWARTPGDLIIIGDQCAEDPITAGKAITANFGTATNLKGMGFNHGDDGINLLRNDGGVNFSPDVFGGANGNNVYVTDIIRDTTVTDYVAEKIDDTATDVDVSEVSDKDTILVRIMQQ